MHDIPWTLDSSITGVRVTLHLSLSYHIGAHLTKKQPPRPPAPRPRTGAGDGRPGAHQYQERGGVCGHTQLASGKQAKE